MSKLSGARKRQVGGRKTVRTVPDQFGNRAERREFERLHEEGEAVVTSVRVVETNEFDLLIDSIDEIARGAA